MSFGNDFVFPGLLDDLNLGDPETLHQGGLDRAQVRDDPVDIFPNDDLSVEDAQLWQHEQLPQFGPPFVQYVHQRFDRMEKLATAMLKRWSYEPVTVILFASMQTDANGNVNRSINDKAIIYEPPPGFTLALHRLTIRNSGNNFGNVFNAATAYWELRVNDEMLDGGSLVAPAAGVTGGSFPIAKTWGTRDALRVRDGEVLSLFISGTNTLANQTITVRGQGTLERQAES